MPKLEMQKDIQTRIYRVRGQQVMVDADLADLYGVKVKALNQAVHRNLKRFPPDFMFQLSSVEFERMRSQIVTACKRNIRYRPLAFTEHGIAMLSSVLRSERAIQVNIAIIKAFIKLRHAALSSRDVARRVEKLEGKVDMHDTDIRLILDDMKRLKRTSIPEGPIPPTII